MKNIVFPVIFVAFTSCIGSPASPDADSPDARNDLSFDAARDSARDSGNDVSTIEMGGSDATIDTADVLDLPDNFEIDGPTEALTIIEVRTPYADNSGATIAPQGSAEILSTSGNRIELSLLQPGPIFLTTNNSSHSINVSWKIQDIAIAERHGCLLTEEGRVHCWGEGRDGTVTNNPPTNEQKSPKLYAPNLTFVSVKVRDNRTCALTTEGTLYCWGDNSSNAIQDGGTPTLDVTEVVTNVQRFDFGTNFLCYTQSDTYQCRGNPNVIGGSSPFNTNYNGLFFTAGNRHYCYTNNSTGMTTCVGNNSQGQLYNNDNTLTTNTIDTPEVLSIFAGTNFTCRDSNATLLCQGFLGPFTGFDQEQSEFSIAKPTTNEIYTFQARKSGICAQDGAGELFCVGGSEASFGLSNSIEFRNAETFAAVLGNVKPAIWSYGGDNLCWVDDNEIRCFGTDEFGVRGNAGSGNTSADTIVHYEWPWSASP